MSTSAVQTGREVKLKVSPSPRQDPPVAARRAVAAVFLINGTLGAGWATRIPAIQQHLHLDPRALGLALLGAAVGALVAMNLAGYLAARWGSSRVTVTAGLLFCASVPLLALAPSLLALVGALVFFGATTGSMDVAMNTQGVAVERRYGRPILTSFHAFFSIGGLTGAFLSGIATGHGVQPLPQFLAMAGLAAAGLLAASRFLLPAVADAGGSTVAFAFPTGALLILGAIGFCSVLGEGAIADWSAIYLLHNVGTGAALAAGGYAAFSLLMAAGRFAGDGLTVRFGPVIMVRLGASMAALGLSLALLIQWTPVALFGFGLVGAGFSAIFPIVLSAAGRARGMASGNAIAAVATCGYVGYLIGPPSIGFIAQAASLRAALSVVVILSLVAAVLAPVVRSRPSEE
ncbi:MAG TPA: MFS transporter [Chloroflexota bacterium]|nr:MFS transporter [Chloroflexota bacterium]